MPRNASSVSPNKVEMSYRVTMSMVKSTKRRTKMMTATHQHNRVRIAARMPRGIRKGSAASRERLGQYICPAFARVLIGRL